LTNQTQYLPAAALVRQGPQKPEKIQPKIKYKLQTGKINLRKNGGLF
jgi:hypothetical protein